MKDLDLTTLAEEWADKHFLDDVDMLMIFKSCRFEDFSPRKGFVCSEYFKSKELTI